MALTDNMVCLLRFVNRVLSLFLFYCEAVLGLLQSFLFLVYSRSIAYSVVVLGCLGIIFNNFFCFCFFEEFFSRCFMFYMFFVLFEGVFQDYVRCMAVESRYLVLFSFLVVLGLIF